MKSSGRTASRVVPNRFVFLAVLVIGLALGGWVAAQQGAPAGQKPGTQSGAGATAFSGIPNSQTPGSNNDYQWQLEYYKPFRIPKQWAIPIENGFYRVAAIMQNHIVQLIAEDGDELVVKNLPLDDPRSYAHDQWLQDQYKEIQIKSRLEQKEKDKGRNFILYKLPNLPPPSVEALTFSVSQSGLPTSGSWQTSFDLADINKDGKLDIILPPARKGTPYPAVVLGDGKGGFSRWAEAHFPTDIKLDYGTARVGDVDGDGNLDIVLACHLTTSYILYGDGKGDFSRNQPLPLKDWFSKSLALADFDLDGRLDIVSFSELDGVMGKYALPGPMVKIFFNKPDGWQPFNDGFPGGVFGDGIVAADINQDKYPDLILTSHAGGFQQNILLNPGKAGGKWRGIAERQMPYDAFVYSVAVGNVCRKKGVSDVFTCFEQVNHEDKEKPAHACVLYHFHDARGRFVEKPEAQVICKDETNAYYLGATIGDVDGDGAQDLVAARSNGTVRVFLQQQPGVFREQLPSPLERKGLTAFDVRVADLNGDGLGEMVVMGTGDKGGVYIVQPKKGSSAAKEALAEK